MTTPEERHAWDLYAAAALSIKELSVGDATSCADQLLAERRKRFGGGTPKPEPRSEP